MLYSFKPEEDVPSGRRGVEFLGEKIRGKG